MLLLKNDFHFRFDISLTSNFILVSILDSEKIFWFGASLFTVLISVLLAITDISVYNCVFKFNKSLIFNQKNIRIWKCFLKIIVFCSLELQTEVVIKHSYHLNQNKSYFIQSLLNKTFYVQSTIFCSDTQL